MNKKILIAGLIVFILLLVPINSAYSNIGIQIENNPIITSNRGNILYVGGNGSGNYSKIQDAIDDASDGDTVFVYDDSSPYKESLKINKTINLIGENKESTIINGNQNINVIYIYNINNITISGFTIQNGDRGICLGKSSYNVVKNNIFLDNNCSFLGGRLHESIISNNIIIGEGRTGIYILDSSNNYIVDNDIINKTNRAILFGNSSYEYVSKNLILNCKYGIELCRVNFSTFSFNNIMSERKYCGFILQLYVSRNNFFKNNILDNNYGIYITKFNGNSNKNTFYFNNFINNKFDISFKILNFNNLWYGNYWDKWIGNKIKLPSFQKFPHIIFNLYGFGIDWHPASEPYDI